MISELETKISRDLLILVAVSFGLLVVSELLAPGFIEIDHLSFILEITAIVGTAALGQTLVILTGGIDLSVGTIMYLMLAIAPRLMGEEFLLPFLICLAVGALVGAVNGILIAWARVPPIIQTIATMTALTGFIFIYSGGVSGAKAHPLLRAMTVNQIGPLHSCTVIWIILIIFFYIILHRTTYGRYIQALGSNPRASYLSGIKVKLTTFSVYTLSGLLSALAGLFFYGYANIPYYPSQTGGLGIDYAFSSITAVVVGGTLFTGGKGGPDRTFFGALFMQLLVSLLVMLGLPQALRLLVNGAILLVIVIIYKLLQKSIKLTKLS
jgi:ribose/xylose/arabinose/galactoside ABC-type transport system permease subunit